MLSCVCLGSMFYGETRISEGELANEKMHLMASLSRLIACTTNLLSQPERTMRTIGAMSYGVLLSLVYAVCTLAQRQHWYSTRVFNSFTE